MAKTKSITFPCASASISPNTGHVVDVDVSEPNVDFILSEIDKYDLIEYVQSNHNPDDIFEQKQLEEWALENGFVKE